MTVVTVEEPSSPPPSPSPQCASFCSPGDQGCFRDKLGDEVAPGGVVEVWPHCPACCAAFHHGDCSGDCLTAQSGAGTPLGSGAQLLSALRSSSAGDLHPNVATAGLRLRHVHPPNQPACYRLATPAVSPSSGEPSAPAVGEVSVLKRLSFIDRFLSLWILLCMVAGVVTGYYSSSAADALNSTQLVTVSLPVAFGLWFMMFPVLVKVRYEALGAIFRHRDTYRQLLFSLTANWAVGPLLMLAIAWATLSDLPHYRAGVIMVGLARCIAMVLLWNQLAGGDADFCAILVTVNSVLQIVLYSPLALFFLVVVSRQYQGGDAFHLQYWDVCRSVFLFLGVPLVAAVLVRFALLGLLGRQWFEAKFAPVISPVALLALLWTIFALFTIQGHQIVDNVGNVCRVAVPMVIYFVVMFSSTLALCRRLGVGYERAVTQAFTASSNNFELAIAVAAGTFGVDSEEALAATVGPLVEVPVLLSLVYVALWLRPRLDWTLKAEQAGRVETGKEPVDATEGSSALELARCR